MLTRCSRAVNPVAQILQHLAVSEETYYRWRNQFGGMKAEEAKRLKELELENEGMRGCTDAPMQGGFSTEISVKGDAGFNRNRRTSIAHSSGINHAD